MGPESPSSALARHDRYAPESRRFRTPIALMAGIGGIAAVADSRPSRLESANNRLSQLANILAIYGSFDATISVFHQHS